MALAVTRKEVAVSVVLAAGVALSLAFAGAAHGASRVALVVGNGGYDPGNISRLANPVNDAGLMATTLESLGFEVSLVTDAGQDAMKQAIKAFGKSLGRAGSDAVGLFYYAGHGVETDGSNYLIPLGASVESAMDLASDAVPAQWVLSRMEAAGNRLNMVILDACRNNPYKSRFRSGSRGLARIDAPSGSLIAYSAAPGQAAADGEEGEHSPYTLALAAALVEPGLKLEDVFKQVRVRVEDETSRMGRKQTPWESSSLRGDFYFVTPEAPVSAPVQTPTAVASASGGEAGPGRLAAKWLEAAARAYEAAERTNTIPGYRLVIENFSGTFYAGLAQAQIEKLEEPAAAVVPGNDGRDETPVAVGERIRDCPECPELVVLPSGSYMMGSWAGEGGRDSG